MIDTEQTPAPAADAPRRSRWIRRVLGALAGLIAASVALGVGELVAGLVRPASSPVVAVGNAAITLVPEPLKEFARGCRMVQLVANQFQQLLMIQHLSRF